MVVARCQVAAVVRPATEAGLRYQVELDCPAGTTTDKPPLSREAIQRRRCDCEDSQPQVEAAKQTTKANDEDAFYVAGARMSAQ